MNGVHDASGDGVSPCRAKKAALVPAGVAAVHDSAPQFTVPAASNTRDTNVPDGRYGVTRTQSTANAPAPMLTSATIGRNGAAIAIACVATTLPSTEYTTDDAVQSIE